jgi:hypothetical protein
MRYLLLHTGAPDLGPAWDDEAWAALTTWLDETIGSGVNVAGHPLRMDADATTVKVRDGQVLVTDGPFAETKEQVAGFDVIECANMDEAVRWAARHPHSWMGATEVRALRALTGDIPDGPLPEPRAGATRYMVFACTDPAVGPEELARIEPVDPWVDEMNGRKLRLFGSELEPPADAHTVRVRDKHAIVTDGPFAETKEQIAGFDVLDCADLDEAIDAVARHPMARGGVMEVRPFRPLGED